MNLVFEENCADPKRAYCRTVSSERTNLENSLLESYGINDESCQVFASGMCAISALFFGVFARKGGDDRQRQTPIAILGNELYSDTPQCAERWAELLQFEVKYIDVRNAFDVLKECNQHARLLFVESCSNPSGAMLDWSLIKQIRKQSPQVIICVDNTWLTSVLFNPFSVKADVVVESLTKYRSGGTCIGGMIVGKKHVVKMTKEFIRLNGQFVGADHSKLFADAQKNIQVRVATASTTTVTVVKALVEQKGVKIVYPLLPPHQSYAIYTKYASPTHGPAVFWMHIESNCSLDDITNATYPKSLKKETSYGSSYSKIDPWPQLGHSNEYDVGTTAVGAQGVWLRVSIGYKSVASEIVTALCEVIAQFQKM